MTRAGRVVRLALVATALAACDGRGDPGEIRLVVAAGHSPAFAWVREFRDVFLPTVGSELADTPHQVVWREAYGGSVAKLGGVLESLEVGIVDVALVASVFEGSKLPLQNLSYFTPFGPQDPEVVLEVMLELEREIAALREAWAEHNAVSVGGFAIETYDLYTRVPVRRLDDLAGLKILAPGPAANWIRGTGAVAVAGDLATYYSDLKTGVADGAVTLATGVWGARLYEVAPFRTPVGIGAQFVGGVAVNREVWERLPALVQQAFRSAGLAFSRSQSAAQRRLAEQRIAQMEALGLTRVDFEPGERARWARALPDIAGRWARQLERRGRPAAALLDAYTEALRDRGVSFERDWTPGG